MKSVISPGFICMVLLVSLGGVCLADSLPGSIIYVQGGDHDITAEPDGTSVITIHDVIPYYHILMKKISSLEPIQSLSDYPYPLQAAVVSSDDKDERISMVVVENLSLSDENRTLGLQVRPLEFYEGSGLKTLASFSENLVADTGREVMNTGLYLEIMENPSSNMGIQECINECTSRGGSLARCWKFCERPVDPVYKPGK